ncbi:sensor histidine kinase [Haloarcula nitratireducens]|uniref:histidine kinase n=1 Tax=Haloarcula nitratireducens TaxID=2487749 RepID=A0AAW4P7S9_9EURY|nr:hybrid sensor histidine kinase/response regulator [Halomicroarcula nitratireducens]MBX0293972.1 hybrid sensor histidine kinase/response regulator [Halomicroarcula nitratireducens]
MTEQGTPWTVVLTGFESVSTAELPTALGEFDDLRAERVGDEALLDRLDSGGVGAVVVGDGPPVQDAVETLDRVREHGASLPVVAVGTDIDAERIETALSAGVSDYVRWRDEDSAGELAARLRALRRTPSRDGVAAADRWERLVRGVAHDAKNPLNVVSGRLELLDVEETHRDAMARSVGRIEALLDELRAVAIASGPVDHVESVALADAAKQAWTGMSANEATLRVETDGSVETDPDSLRLVFERLFENALVHAGPDVTVTVGDADGGFSVADDGPGIPAADRDEALEQGYSTVPGNEGYGLFVAARVAAERGWTLDLTESESGGVRAEVTVR